MGILLLSLIRNKGKRSLKSILTSIDDIFIIFGIILNGISAIISLVLGHGIAGIILVICEIILIGIYLLKML